MKPVRLEAVLDVLRESTAISVLSTNDQAALLVIYTAYFCITISRAGERSA